MNNSTNNQPTDAAADAKVREAPPERFFGYYPGTVAVITAAHEGDRNVMSAGWHTPLSFEPPLYGVVIGEARYTYGLIKRAGSFAVNMLPFSHAEAIAAAGSTSRNNGIDKFEQFGIEVEEPLVTSAPILRAAYVAYECVLQEIVRAGDHDLFIGEVVALHYNPAEFDERLLFDPKNGNGAVYLGRGEYLPLASERRAVFHPSQFRE